MDKNPLENCELGVFSWLVFGKVRASHIAASGCTCWLKSKPLQMQAEPIGGFAHLERFCDF
jgi:hypothetical protein